MKALELITPAHLFVEIGQEGLKLFNGTAGLELPLERSPDGRLTEACKVNVSRQLQTFIQHKSWQARPRVFCAIGARGVSLRRLSLPATSKEELNRLLPLQIESEFPLPPEQLAWGYQVLDGAKTPASPANGRQEVLVAAVKKDNLEEFLALFSQCGTSPVFCLAALARSYVCPQPSCPYLVLAVGRGGSELISFEAGVPVAVRVLPWGSEQLDRSPTLVRGAMPSRPGVLGESTQGASFGGSFAVAPEAQGTADPVEVLAGLLNGQASGRRIYVLSPSEPIPSSELAARLRQRLPADVDCLPVELSLGLAPSAAILGLQKAIERVPGWPPLVLQAQLPNGKAAQMAQQAPLKWAAAALGLLVLALLLPYAEALTLKTHLAKKLAAIKADQSRLVTMDRELDFLEYLQQNQPPYLDALLVLAKAAPPGSRFDSVSMNRRGEIALRGSLHDGQQVAELRSKLIDSGFFESVGIEEQTPSPDHQKVTVRMNALWKPAGERKKPQLEAGRAPDSKHSANPAGGVPPGASPNPGPPAPVVPVNGRPH